MSVSPSTQIGDAQSARPARAGERGGYVQEDRGHGWIVFAGVMLMLAGTSNVIYGIGAISNSKFYVANTRYVISDLHTWGWIVTILGALQLCAAFGVWAGANWARWTGVALASLNAIAQLLFLPSYPWLALAVFTMDLLVIYALVAYGGRPEVA
jgi:hypothetical protein